MNSHSQAALYLLHHCHLLATGTLSASCEKCFQQGGVAVPAAHHTNHDSQAQAASHCCARCTCFMKLSQLPAQALPITTCTQFCWQGSFLHPCDNFHHFNPQTASQEPPISSWGCHWKQAKHNCPTRIMSQHI